MLFGKSNLMVRKVASKNRNDRVLNSVHIADDGTTVASNAKCLMAVSPIPEERMNFPDVGGNDVKIPIKGINVPLEIVDQAIKSMTKDKRVSLQNVKLTDLDEDELELTGIDMMKMNKVRGRIMEGSYPNWRGVLQDAYRKSRGGRICVDRRDLISVLTAIDSAADADDDGAIFLEFGEQLLVQNYNFKTGQNIVAVLMKLDIGDLWLKFTDWSKKVFSLRAGIKK